MVYTGLAKVIRRVPPPGPIDEEKTGDAKMAQDLNKSVWRALANPWDEDVIKEVAALPFPE
eukprot:5466195-Lingulodinium_polyedra.AAC.1